MMCALLWQLEFKTRLSPDEASWNFESDALISQLFTVAATSSSQVPILLKIPTLFGEKHKTLNSQHIQPTHAFHQGAHPYLQKGSQEVCVFIDVFLISDTEICLQCFQRNEFFGYVLTTGPFKDFWIGESIHQFIK